MCLDVGVIGIQELIDHALKSVTVFTCAYNLAVDRERIKHGNLFNMREKV